MLALPGDEDEIHFESMGVSNMPDSNDRHMHEHIIAFNEKDQVDATWILWNDGEEAERRFFPMERRWNDAGAGDKKPRPDGNRCDVVRLEKTGLEAHHERLS